MRKIDPAPDASIGVAVSGGADSVYLLYHCLQSNRRLTVLHVNHGLRGEESDADEAFVRDLATLLSLPFLAKVARPGEGNLEQECRQIRYSWFRDLIRLGVIERIALGHTRSDQAETVLFRFLRGSGTAGLAGIRPNTSDGFFRPLLHLNREEVRASLCERGIPWREDRSNAELRFARNRIRHELLPQLVREWNPAMHVLLAQTADWAGAEEDYWAAEIERAAQSRIVSQPPYALVRSHGLPLALERRLIRHAIALAKGDLRQVGFAHVEQIRGLRAGRTCIPGLLAERSFEWLRIGPVLPRAPGYRLVVKPPGIIYPPGLGSGLRLELIPAESVYNNGKQQLDWRRLSGPLELRNWRSGDRYRRAGHSNEERIKVLFQKARIPVWERNTWPVLLCGGRVVWAKHFGAAADSERTGDTRSVLVIHELPDSTENRNQNVYAERLLQ